MKNDLALPNVKHSYTLWLQQNNTLPSHQLCDPSNLVNPCNQANGATFKHLFVTLQLMSNASFIGN